jgi:hypothetical protein
VLYGGLSATVANYIVALFIVVFPDEVSAHRASFSLARLYYVVEHRTGASENDDCRCCSSDPGPACCEVYVLRRKSVGG